jgi:hypothetical protein
MSGGKGAVDLDAILEDAIQQEGLAGANNSEAAALAAIEPKLRVVSDDVKPWLAFTANVAKEYREKWTKMAKVDTETEITSRFQSSYAYKSWDGPIPTKNGINRSLQELVRKAATVAKLDEVKAARLMTLVNPVTDSENGKQLQAGFAKQLITDYAKDIKDDPNFDPSRFPALATAVSRV